MEQTPDTCLHAMVQENGGKLTAKMVCDARDAGDALADRVFNDYCDYLACGLTNLINVFQPDAIVIGGGVAGYGEKLLIAAARARPCTAVQDRSEGSPIVAATLGNDAGIIAQPSLIAYFCKNLPKSNIFRCFSLIFRRLFVIINFSIRIHPRTKKRKTHL